MCSSQSVIPWRHQQNDSWGTIALTAVLQLCTTFSTVSSDSHESSINPFSLYFHYPSIHSPIGCNNNPQSQTSPGGSCWARTGLTTHSKQAVWLVAFSFRSERVSKSNIGGTLLTEAKYINLSLHYLEQVILALSEKGRTHVPYRNSMMTSVLRDRSVWQDIALLKVVTGNVERCEIRKVDALFSIGWQCSSLWLKKHANFTLQEGTRVQIFFEFLGYTMM